MKKTVAGYEWTALVETLMYQSGYWIREPVILAGGSMASILGELKPRFELEEACRLNIHYDGAPGLVRRTTSGEPFDLVIVPTEVIEDPATAGRFAAGPTTDIASVDLSVAVGAGAARPEVGSPEAFRRALLEAKSVALFLESGSGAHIQKVFERLGIAAEMEKKTVRQKAPPEVARALAAGEAELALFATNLLIAPGVDIVGPFPDAFQLRLTLTAAVGANAAHPDLARAFIAHLTTPAAAEVIRAKGMVPAFAS